jgi:hypothetical protein
MFDGDDHRDRREILLQHRSRKAAAPGRVEAGGILAINPRFAPGRYGSNFDLLD